MKKLVTICFLTCWSLCLSGQQIEPPLQMEIDFALKYHFWKKIQDMTWEVASCESDSLPLGARYYLTSWTPTLIDGFHNLKFWLMKKVGNKIIFDNTISTTDCAITNLDDKIEEYFLLGINNEGKIIYMSGDIILNEIAWYLDDSQNYNAIAATRLAFLLPDGIREIHENANWITYSSRSGLFKGKKYYIQISKHHVDQFQIWVGTNRHCPIQDTREK